MANTVRPPHAALLLLAIQAVFSAAPAAAAEPSGAVIPSIAVSGTAQVTAPAARGAFSIGIEVQRPDAAAASAEAARITRSVSAALKQSGLAAGELKGTRLTVSAQWSYDDKTRQQRRDGFLAASTLNVDTTALERLGGYIDAALNAGATRVTDIAYSPADADALRREALAGAVRQARDEADTIAVAAGGRLGELLEISTERAGEIRPMGLPQVMVTGARRTAVPTQIQPGDIEVDASVTARWRFTPTK